MSSPAWKRHLLPPGREGMFDAYSGYLWTDLAGKIWTDISNTTRTWTKVT